MNFTYTVVIEKNWGSPYGNGSWNGIVGMLQREVIDIGESKISKNENNCFKIHYLMRIEPN